MRASPRQLIDRVRERTQLRAAALEAARERESSELRERIAMQWAEARALRKAATEAPVIVTGPSNFNRAQVPWGYDLAAAWAWRFIAICGGLTIILWLLHKFMVVVLPLVIALLIAALVAPVVGWLVRLGLPRKFSALLVVLFGIGVITLLLSFVGTQVASGIDNLSGQVVTGLGQIRDWLRHGPLQFSDNQIDKFIKDAQSMISAQGKDAVSQITELSTAVGHIVAGFFIVLFSTFFFLADGSRIWAWTVRLFPRAARVRADSSGRVAWHSLTQFVRATVLVAGTDAIGIMIVAAVLGLPFVSAIGVLVFIGAFVPMIGATVSGVVAVLVALVAQGPVAALIMLAGVIVVQQIEAHILQPFLMGRFVSVHPLGVIVAIAMGVIVAGIPGALIAVPLAASLNAVVQHLAGFTEVGEDPVEAAEDDPAPTLTADQARADEESAEGGTTPPTVGA